MNYFKPDDTWDVFGIQSREDYVQKNVIPGKFHPTVPEDIVKSFRTVTQLTAQAYYYYPLYDEALNKALRIFELAIKLKANQLGIKKDSLHNLINKVCKNQNLSHLIETLDRARKIRNMQMHPEKHSSGWYMAKGKANIRMFANFINEMFLEDEELALRQAERKKMENIQHFLSKGPISVKAGDKEFFVQKIDAFRIFSKSGELKIALCLMPFYDDIIDRINNLDSAPYYIILDKFVSNENEIEGSTVDGTHVIIKKAESEIAFKIQKVWSDKIETLQNNPKKRIFF